MRKIVPAALALYLVIAPHTCKQIRTGSGVMNERAPSEPLIRITPLRSGREQWKIAATTEITVTITAPNAETVQIFARPVGVGENYLELQTLATPVDSAKGEFSARVSLPPDFAGFLWAMRSGQFDDLESSDSIEFSFFAGQLP